MLQAQGASYLGKRRLLLATILSPGGCLGGEGLCRHPEVQVCAGVEAEAVEGE